MKVAFYVDPFFQFQLASFRKFPIIEVFPIFARQLKELYPNTATHLFAGFEPLYKSLSVEAPIGCYDYITPIDQRRTRRTWEDGSTKKQIDLTEFDLVIVWESDLEKLILRGDQPRICLSPGIFSRTPYPYHLTVDFQGFLSKSSLSEINPTKLNNKSLERAKACNILLDSMKFSLEHAFEMLVPPYIKYKLKQYDKILLVPLQMGGYFATDHPSGSSQAEFLEFVLEQTPSNVGVLVTQYKTPDIQDIVLSSENIDVYSAKYPNLIYDTRLETISNVSQVLLPHVDAVVTVSSSVGLQAVLMKKVLITYGNSHLSSLSDLDLATSKYLFPIRNNSEKKSKVVASLVGSYFLPIQLLGSDAEYVKNIVDSAFHREKTATEKINASVLRDFYSKRFLHYSKNWKRSYQTDNINIENFKSIVDRIFDPSIRTISFDVFDTLIARKTLTPLGVFREVERRILHSDWKEKFSAAMNESPYGDYCSCRIKSEQMARERVAEDCSRNDCTFEEIFEELGRTLGSAILGKRLLETEWEVEQEFAEARSIGKILFKAAELSQKRIVFLSDMYLSSEQIQCLLNKCGYQTECDIMVSSEYGVNKNSGGLFVALLLTYNLDPNSTFHIGDNNLGDYRMPKVLGIQSALVLSRYVQWRRTYGAAYGIDTARNIEEEYLFGAQARKIYDNPFPDGGENVGRDRRFPLFRGSPEMLGFSVVGPLVTQICQWIADHVYRYNCSKVIFCARDGYVFYKVMRTLYPEQKEMFEYLYISRRTANLASIRSFSDIERVCRLRFSECTIEHLFAHRFGVFPTGIGHLEVSPRSIVSHDRDLGLIIEIARLNYQAILNRSAHAKNGLRDHIRGKELYDLGEAIIFDLGYGGSIQKGVERAIEQSFAAGLYFATFSSSGTLRYDRENIHVFSVKDEDPGSSRFPFIRAVHVFETLFSHVEGTNVDYLADQERTKPVLQPEQANKAKQDFTCLLWLGCEEFVKTFLEVPVCQPDLDWDDWLAPFNQFVRNPHPADLGIFVDCSFENNFSGEKAAPIIASDRGECWWKYGQKIYDRSDPKITERQALGTLTEKGLEKMYIDYLEEVVVKELKERISELESLLEQVGGEQSRNLGASDQSGEKRSESREVEFPDSTPGWFDNNSYLAANPDVNEAVKNGSFVDGYEHYRRHGYREGRPLKVRK